MSTKVEVGYALSTAVEDGALDVDRYRIRGMRCRPRSNLTDERSIAVEVKNDMSTTVEGGG